MFVSLEMIHALGYISLVLAFLFPCICFLSIRNNLVAVSLSIITLIMFFAFVLMAGFMTYSYDGYYRDNFYKINDMHGSLDIEFLTNDIYGKYSEISINDKRMCSPKMGDVISIDASNISYRTLVVMKGLPRNSEDYETFYSKYVISRLRC